MTLTDNDRRVLREIEAALPSVVPVVSEGEYTALLVWAMLHASGGTMTRTDLARAFALRARPDLLKRRAPASLEREAIHWATVAARRPPVTAGMLVPVLGELDRRGGVLLGASGETGATVSTSPHTPPEARLDPWFRFEADLILRVQRDRLAPGAEVDSGGAR